MARRSSRSFRYLERTSHRGVDAAEVGDDLARLEALLARDRQVPLERLLGGADRRGADAELGRVEVDRAAGAGRPVRERIGGPGRPEAREAAGGDRVIDGGALGVF